MKEKISKAIGEALEKSRKLNITFRPDTAGHIYFILAMQRNDFLSLKDGDKQVLMNIMKTFDWGKHNRTVTIKMGHNFDRKFFIDRMHDALEKIEAIN